MAIIHHALAGMFKHCALLTLVKADGECLFCAEDPNDVAALSVLLNQ